MNPRLAVKPGPSESPAWAGEWQLSIHADTTYFLAIRNDVEIREEIKGWYIGIPMPYVVTKGSTMSLRHEMLSEQEALPEIQELKYVKPIAAAHAP